MTDYIEAIAARMREAAAKVQLIMPGHGVMLNAANVLALLDAFDAVKKERDEAREELSTWRSVFPDIAPDSVLPDRSKVEARVAALSAILVKAGTFLGDRSIFYAAHAYEAKSLLTEIEAALASQAHSGEVQ